MESLIAVFRDRHDADDAVRTLVDRGVPATAIHVESGEARAHAIDAEMEAQVSESWMGLGVGSFVTAEMMRGVLVFMAVLAPLGLVVGAVLGAVLFTETGDTWVRVLVGALIGTVFGLAVGGIVGGGFAMQSPNEPMAAESGVTIQVDGASPQVAGTLRGYTPLRIDRFVDGQYVATEETAGTQGVARTAHDFGETVADPGRQG
jgi:hypothetical protein